MKVKQISQWLHKNSKIKYLIRLLIIAAVAWVLRFWEFEERRNRNYYEYDIIHFLRREMLDFTAFPVFFVSNLLLVQRKKYYFNRATVSRNCSIVL
mgnify:CR=1 FL=1